MLYNKRAVQNPEPVTREQLALAEKYDPFHLTKRDLEKVKDIIGSAKSVEDITFKVYLNYFYDEKHKFQGTRTAHEVVRDEQGHCIELNTLLFTVLSGKGYKPEIVVYKNPKGYDCGSSPDEFGVHSFVVVRHRRSTYYADAVWGDVKTPEKSLGTASVHLDYREFIAFHLHDAGEDFGIFHKKYRKAIATLKQAARIDPNNYTIFVTMGDVYFLADDFKKATTSYENAIAIAPTLLDPHKVYGDFLLDGYESPEFAVQEYKAALEKRTKDIQILKSLELILKEIGERTLAAKARKMRQNVKKGAAGH